MFHKYLTAVCYFYMNRLSLVLLWPSSDLVLNLPSHLIFGISMNLEKVVFGFFYCVGSSSLCAFVLGLVRIDVAYSSASGVFAKS